ncbi:MAG TPA: PqqD family protein [Haliangiales bacterium]|nr:PqqD family protein [Haliangiales bacterium]
MTQRKPPAEQRYRPKSLLSLSPTGFLLDNANGESYTLNAVGRAVMAKLLELGDSRDVWRVVVDRFEIDEARAQKDVERFLADLWTLGLVERDERDRR